MLKKFDEFINEKTQNVKTGGDTVSYMVTAKDDEGTLKKLLDYIKSNGNTGHSFYIVVDPDDKDHKKEFFWDGDGSDYIESVKIHEEPKETPKEVKESASTISNGKAFSINSTKIGDKIDVQGKSVEVTEFIAWTKNSEKDCVKFKGKLDGKPVTVLYDDGQDGYKIMEN